MEQTQKYTIPEFINMMKRLIPALKDFKITKTHVIMVEEIESKKVAEKIQPTNRGLPTDSHPAMHQ
jgi:hypothetical protein